MGLKKVHDPKQLVFTVDHAIQDSSASNLAKYKKIAAYAEEQGVDCK